MTTTLIPLTGQLIYLAKPIALGDTTMQTIGKFTASSVEVGIIGKQILCISPWTTSMEFVYVDVTVEPTIIEDRSADGKENIYEYTIAIRGIHSDNTEIPPTKYADARKKAHKFGGGVIIPISTEYFTELVTLFETATNNRSAQAFCFDAGTDVTVGDDRWRIVIPTSFDGATISSVRGVLFTAGATGSTTVQVYNVTNAENVLSDPVTFADTATTGSGTIDAAKASVSTDDMLRVDVDTVTTTKAKGMIIIIEFTI